MDRIAFLQKRSETDNIRLLRQFIRCLTPQEACDLLDLNFRQSPQFREKVIERIVSDMTEHLDNCHNRLLEDLLSCIDNLPASKYISWAYCIESFCYKCDSLTHERIIRKFLSSDRKDFRNRAYKILGSHWDAKYIADLNAVWLDTFDYNCTLLLTQYANPEFLLHNFELMYQLLDFNSMGKFFRRLPKVDRTMLEQLKADDEITYTYVLAVLNLSLTDAEALQIYETNKADNRLNILIWAYSMMNLWDILVHIDTDAESVRRLNLQANIGHIQFPDDSGFEFG